MPARVPDELGAPLVHRQRGGHHAAAGVRNPQRLERALHGAVLAEAAVQRDEARARSRSRFSSHRSRSAGSNACASTPFSRSAASTRVAGQERDLALGRRPAHQHRDLAEFAHASLIAASPMMRTSGSRSTPVFARTVSRTCAISASMSAALARAAAD